jgi:SAM-dependent methyltransferase
MASTTLTECLACGSQDLRTARDTDLDFCQQCGLAFVNPQPSLDDVATFYSRKGKYKTWIDDTAARDLLWQRRLTKIRPYAVGSSLLDIGAGTGQFLHHAKTLFPSVSGTELSTSGIEEAARRYGIDLIHGDLGSISFDRQFDNITMFHLLEHVHRPREALLKCHSLLNAGGRLFIAVPNDLHSARLRARTFLKRILKGQKSNKYGLPKLILDGSVDELHLSQFTPASLKNIVTSAGFEIDEISIDPYFVSSGLRTVRSLVEYAAFNVMQRLTRVNLYDAIWLVARKA